MRSLRRRLGEVAVGTFLWCQRGGFPFPMAAHNVARRVLSRTVDPACQGSGSEPDKWPDSSTNKDLAGREINLRMPKRVRSTPNVLWRAARPRLRRMVATGTLNLGGFEMVALSLARGLPLHDIDAILAHTPLAHSDERPAASLRLEGVPVVKVAQGDAQQWLEANRPDVISMHSPPDWFVAAAAKAGIPSIETLHGAHSFFDKDSWPSEQKRSGQITDFVAVSEPLRRHYLRANPEYPLDRIVTIPNGVDGQQISRGDRARARGSVCGRNSYSHRWRATSCKRTRLGLSTHLPMWHVPTLRPIFSVRVAWLIPCILGKFDDSATDALRRSNSFVRALS
jgi:hypothetical protein